MVLHSHKESDHSFEFLKPYVQRKFILSKIDDPWQFDADLQQLIFGTGGLVQACHMGFKHLGRVVSLSWVSDNVGESPCAKCVGRHVLLHCAIMWIIGRNR